jgi:MoxR-like ATPase
VLDIIFATRQPSRSGMKRLQTLIETGASPRATIWLIKAAKANAFLSGRGYVTPDDIKQLAPDVLRHRIITSFEAQAEGITGDKIIEVILSKVEVP